MQIPKKNKEGLLFFSQSTDITSSRQQVAFITTRKEVIKIEN